MSLPSRLIELTDIHCKQIEQLPALQDMLAGRYTRQRYAQLLMSLYPIVSNFCPLMAAAAGRCADRDAELRNYLYDHIEDEKGHESMVLDDLAKIGWDGTNVPTTLPCPPVQAMLAYNYHAIDRIDPHYVIGMVYVLEIISSVYGSKVAQAIAKAIDQPATQGFGFLESHSTLDDDHLAELRKLVQAIRKPGIEEVLINSVSMNFYLFKQVLGYTEAA